MSSLATASGWRRVRAFSPLLYADFAATPLTLERLMKLGEVLGVPADRVFEASR